MNLEPTFEAPFELKEIGVDGTFTGYASVFNNVDFGSDVIATGAFAKTLAKRPPAKVKMLWQHDPAQPIGVWESMTEDKRGLLVKGRLLTKQDIPMADQAYALLKAGALDAMSIGFNIPAGGYTYNAKTGVRTITEADLWEVSLVTFPMNDRARITSVKAVTAFQDLALADRGRTWDGTAAEGRVRSWAGGGTSLADLDWGQYRKAFVWYDAANADQVTSYKLQIADVIGGNLVAVPRAIFAAAGAVLGARGGLDVPEADRPRIISHLERYYAKMDMDSPFKAIDMGAMKSAVQALLATCVDARDFEQTLRDVGFSVKEAKATASLLHNLPQRDVETTTRKAALQDAIEELKLLS